jgi:hypothetical protein
MMEFVNGKDDNPSLTINMSNYQRVLQHFHPHLFKKVRNWLSLGVSRSATHACAAGGRFLGDSYGRWGVNPQKNTRILRENTRPGQRLQFANLKPWPSQNS